MQTFQLGNWLPYKIHPGTPEPSYLHRSCMALAGAACSLGQQCRCMSWPDDLTPAHQGPSTKRPELVVADLRIFGLHSNRDWPTEARSLTSFTSLKDHFQPSGHSPSKRLAELQTNGQASFQRVVVSSWLITLHPCTFFLSCCHFHPVPRYFDGRL